MLLALRDRNIPMPVAAACMSPFVDMQFSGESVSTNRENDWNSVERLVAIRAAYLAGHDPTDPIASPLHARLNGLPRLYIQAGTHELLVDSISAFVKKVRWAGVPVHYDAWEGMFHCWQVFATQVPQGQEAIDRMGVFVRGT
jgi:acetyl esterase/lipase